MPNWVRNTVRATPAVIQSMVNEDGNIDFNKTISFDGTFNWDSIDYSAEKLAENIIDSELYKLMSRFSRSSPELFGKLTDEGFEQFIQMLRNFRQYGALHDMDFALRHWGTK